MKSTTGLLRKLWFPGVLLVLAAAPVAAVEVTPWKALATSGAVSRQISSETADEWASVKRGDALEPATVVRTGKRGRATLARNTNVLIVDPRSELELPAGDGDARVHQTAGSVVYDIGDRGDESFVVETPYLVAGVKGTVFGVTVTDRYALVSVAEGVVEIHVVDDESPVELQAGDEVMIDAVDRRLERMREGDDRDRSRERTDKTRDRMKDRLRAATDLADRRLNDRRDRGIDDHDEDRKVDSRTVAALADVANEEIEHHEDELDDDKFGLREDDLDDLDKDLIEDIEAEDPTILFEDLDDEQTRQDNNDDLDPRTDPDGSQGASSN